MVCPFSRLMLILLLLLSTGCAALNPSTSDTAQQPACQDPDMLIRDLTVPWPERTYLVGPCPSPSASQTTTRR